MLGDAFNLIRTMVSVNPIKLNSTKMRKNGLVSSASSKLSETTPESQPRNLPRPRLAKSLVHEILAFSATDAFDDIALIVLKCS